MQDKEKKRRERRNRPEKPKNSKECLHALNKDVNFPANGATKTAETANIEEKS